MKKLLSVIMALAFILSGSLVFAEEAQPVGEPKKVVVKLGETEELVKLLSTFIEQPYEVWQVAMEKTATVVIPIERKDIKEVYLLDGRSMQKTEYKLVEGGIEVTGRVALFIVQFGEKKIEETKPKETVKPTEKVVPKETVSVENKKDKVPNTGAHK